ncbi:uncharacterized protein LOC144441524 [Glandiceps talaboti]
MDAKFVIIIIFAVIQLSTHSQGGKYSCIDYSKIVGDCGEHGECIDDELTGARCQCFDGFEKDYHGKCNTLVKEPIKFREERIDDVSADCDFVCRLRKRLRIKTISSRAACGASCLPGRFIKRALGAKCIDGDTDCDVNKLDKRGMDCPPDNDMDGMEKRVVKKKRDVEMGCIEGENCPPDQMNKRDVEMGCIDGENCPPVKILKKRSVDEKVDCGASCLPSIEEEKRDVRIACINGVNCPPELKKRSVAEQNDCGPGCLPEIEVEKRDIGIECLDGINCPPGEIRKGAVNE